MSRQLRGMVQFVMRIDKIAHGKLILHITGCWSTQICDDIVCEEHVSHWINMHTYFKLLFLDWFCGLIWMIVTEKLLLDMV